MSSITSEIPDMPRSSAEADSSASLAGSTTPFASSLTGSKSKSIPKSAAVASVKAESFSFQSTPKSKSRSQRNSKSAAPTQSLSLSSPDSIPPSSDTEKTKTSDEPSSSYSSYYYLSIIVIILLFIGVNIFYYLGAITEYLRDFFGPIIADVMRSIGYTASNGATGAKTGIDVASGTVVSGLDVLQGQLDSEDASNKHDGTGASTRSPINGGDDESGLRSALIQASNSASGSNNDSNHLSRNGEVNFTGKSGYCYVGEDRGFRSCVSVSPDDTCMSGDIFPSMDICINPSLRE